MMIYASCCLLVVFLLQVHHGSCAPGFLFYPADVYLGDSYDVRFETRSTGDAAGLELWKGGERVGALSGNDIFDGEFSWTVSTSLIPGEDYRLKMLDTRGGGEVFTSGDINVLRDPDRPVDESPSTSEVESPASTGEVIVRPPPQSSSPRSTRSSPDQTPLRTSEAADPESTAPPSASVDSTSPGASTLSTITIPNDSVNGPPTSTPTSAIETGAPPGSSLPAQDGPSGMTTAAKAGVGVGASTGIICLLLFAFFLGNRFRMKANTEPTSPTKSVDSEADTFGKPELHGVSIQWNELDGTYHMPEMHGQGILPEAMGGLGDKSNPAELGTGIRSGRESVARASIHSVARSSVKTIARSPEQTVVPRDFV